MAAGDVTFHSGWLLHSAPANRTDHLREAMIIADWSPAADTVPRPQSVPPLT